MDVRQCPRCELRFEREAELKSHLVIDHDVEPEALEGEYVGDDEDQPPAADPAAG